MQRQANWVQYQVLAMASNKGPIFSQLHCRSTHEGDVSKKKEKKKKERSKISSKQTWDINPKELPQDITHGLSI